MARQFRSDDTDLWLDKYGNGSDGAGSINTSTDATANTTFSGTETQSTGTAGSGTGFAAGNLVLIHQSRNGGDGAGVWELNKISSVGGGTNWTLAYPLQNDYATTAQVYLLKQYSSYEVNSGQTLTSSAWDGTKGGIIAVLCNGAITITGNIVATGKGYVGKTVTSGGGDENGLQGEGTAGAGTTSTAANGNGGGGANGGSGASKTDGGGAGHATSGTVGQAGPGTRGAGGDAVGVAALTTMVFGGGGGTGSVGGSQSSTSGTGGAIVFLIGKTINITGSIASNGANGNAAASDKGAGGNGAGGSVLFKGQTITLGSSLVTAAAGTTGTTASVGRIHADYSTSISGTTSPTIDSRIDTSLADPSGALFFALI